MLREAWRAVKRFVPRGWWWPPRRTGGCPRARTAQQPRGCRAGARRSRPPRSSAGPSAAAGGRPRWRPETATPRGRCCRTAL
eukprot:scaffold42693_cov28-Prasinocladus_malaysianus.AAC.1